MFGYSLGRAQKIQHNTASHRPSIIAHGAVMKMNKVLENTDLSFRAKPYKEKQTSTGKTL